MIKEIINRKGEKFIIIFDDEDIDIWNFCKWSVYKDNRIRGTKWNSKKNKYENFYLYRKIMEKYDNINGLDIDHINHNILDNRKCNLRACSHSKNMMNQQTQIKNKTSIYKGVRFYKRTNKWVSQIKINQKYNHIGFFTSEIEAAKAYDNKAIELFGEFANLNFK